MSREILTKVIDPALALLEPYNIPVTDKARTMLYAIGLQESKLVHRYKNGMGWFGIR